MTDPTKNPPPSHLLYNEAYTLPPRFSATGRKASLDAHSEASVMCEVVAGIRQLPLRSPTLPPAEHTNAYIIGDERIIIVDPASYELEEREKLGQILHGLKTKGAQLAAVVLTHDHFDHHGAAEWVATQFDLPIWAHENTAKKLADTFKISRFLNEGDVIDLGLDRSGQAFRLRVLFTPGHAVGHIVLCDQRQGSDAMIVGDMVAAVGSIIIDPDDGDMAQYIEQLRRLLEKAPSCLFPAHGPPILKGPEKLQHYIDHRLAREAKVLAALSSCGSGKAADLLENAYSDTPKALYPLAERACLSHLIKLEREGKIRVSGNTYIL